MRYLLVLTTLLFTLNTAKAQLSGQAKIDSLLKELPKMKEDTNGVNLLSTLSRDYYSTNPDKGIQYGLQGVELVRKIKWKKGEASCYNSLGINYAGGKSNYLKGLEYFHKSLEIYEELNDKYGIAKNLGNMGIIYEKQSIYSKALEYYNKALNLNQKVENRFGIANNLGNIGNIYELQSIYPKALEYYQKALKINEELRDKSGIANNLGNIGNIYVYQSNFPKALEYYNKALKLNETVGNKYRIAINLGNIGNIYILQSNFSKASEYYNKALKLNETVGNKYGIANNLGNIGIAYSSISDFTRSLEYYHKALKIYKELANKQGIANIVGNIGELYLKLSQDTIINKSENKLELLLNRETNLYKSIEYTENAIEIFKEINDLNNQSIFLNNLSQAYQLKGNYKKALEAKEVSYKLKDSVFNKESQDKISALEKAREDDVNKLKIEKQEIQLQAQEDERQLIILSAIGALLSVLIILSVIIIQRRKSEKLLLNVLPAKIAKRLKAKEHPIADHFDGASIIFIDIVGFTSLSSDADPKRIVSVLNDIFTIFDKLADKYGLEKIKTIGDAYMAVAGIPEIQADHTKRTAQMALDIKQEMKDFKTSDGTEIKFRIGIDCGAVVAGVIGEKKFIYDLWSDAVNTASRMESTGESGQIQITDNFKSELEKFEGNWNFNLRGEFEIKGKGLMKTYYLD